MSKGIPYERVIARDNPLIEYESLGKRPRLVNRPRRWIALATVAAVAWVIYASSKPDPVRQWCKNDVHIGDYLTNLAMPSHNLWSASNGVWKYTDNVKITFVDFRVYDKECG